MEVVVAKSYYSIVEVAKMMKKHATGDVVVVDYPGYYVLYVFTSSKYVVLVLHDILGLYEEIPPFAKKYVDLSSIVVEAVSKYVEEVRKGIFPEKKHYFLSQE